MGYGINDLNFTQKVPISTHLRELKDRLIQVAIVLLIFFGISFYFIAIPLGWLQDPLPDEFNQLTFLTPTEPFFTNTSITTRRFRSGNPET